MNNDIYAMVVCRSHDTAGILAHGVFISRPTGKNPDPLSKYVPTGKIQIHRLGHKVVHIVTHNIKNLSHINIVTRNIKYLSTVFINILFIYINLIKQWHKKKTVFS